MSRESFKVAKSLLLKPTSVPVNPQDGEVYYDNSLNQFRKYENGAWGPLGPATGPVITDWAIYTPTVTAASGTLTNYTTNFSWRRVGSDIEVKGVLIFSGAPGTWTNPRFSLPAGLTTTANSYDQTIGSAAMLDSGSNTYPGGIYFISNSVVETLVLNTAAAALSNLTASQTVPFTWASPDQVRVSFKVPIAGWSSNTQMSDSIVWADDVGSITAFGISGASAPIGFLFANGAAVSRTTYAELFAKIGTTFGAGDGSTTFNLPNLQGVVLRGTGSQTMSGRTKTGPALGVQQEDQFQSHRHLSGARMENQNFSYGATNTGLNNSVIREGESNTTQPWAANSSQATVDGANGAPRIGGETRVASVGVNYFIRYVRTAAPNISGNLTGDELLQGGNDFGTAISVGTTDNFALNFITNNTIKFVIGSAISSISVPNSNTLIDSSMVLAAGSAVSGNNDGGNVNLIAGAGSGTGVRGRVVATGNVIPTTNVGYNLGESATRWSILYTDIANVNTTVLNGPTYTATIAASALATENITLTLPKNTGEAGHALTTNGAGVLSWAKLPDNFVTNGTAINLDGYATYADAAGAAPVDGTGGSPTVTWATTTSSPLSGIRSFLFTKDAANRQGQGASYDFTIDRASQTKVMKISFDFETGGTIDVGSSNIAPGDMRMWIYDKDAGILIQPSTIYLGGVRGQFDSTFQVANITSTNYRLIWHVGTTSASAFTLKTDNISVAPSQYVYGTPVTDWQTFTPTGSWTTNTTYTGRYRRIGDSAEIEWIMNLTGAPNNTALTMNAPPGLSFDLAKTGQISSTAVSNASMIIGGGIFSGSAYVGSSSAIAVRTWLANGTYVQHSDIANNAIPAVWGNGSQGYVRMTVPIVGWSSSVRVSDGYNDRRVEFRVGGNGATTTVTNGATTKLGNFTTPSIDTVGAWDAPNNRYYIRSSDIYDISAMVRDQNKVFNSHTSVDLTLAVNGSVVTFLDIFQAPAAQNFWLTLRGTRKLQLNAGDYVELFYSNNSTGSNSNVAIEEFSVGKSAGSATISATETVSAVGTNQSGQVLTSGSWTTITTPTIVDNSHGALNTSGTFRAPIAGRYLVAIGVNFTANGTGYRGIRVMKLGAVTNIGSLIPPSAAGVTTTPTASGVLYLNANDTVDFQAVQTSGGNLALGNSGDVGTIFSIIRIGL